MEVSTSVSIRGGASWLASSFSPYFFPSPSSPSSSHISSSGRVPVSAGNGGGGDGGVGDSGHTQWQWAQVAELVPLPRSVIDAARYFSLDLDPSPHCGGSGSGSGSEWTILQVSDAHNAGNTGSTGSTGHRVRHRARFVESLVFCGAVALIIFTAANSAS